MKTFISSIFPKIKEYSQKLDDLSLLTNQHLVLLDELAQSKTAYIFRDSGELLISRNGKVEKAKWEYLGNKSLLIDIREDSFLFKQSFYDGNIFALKLDSKEEYAVMVNESRYEGEINSIEKAEEFLKSKYLEVNRQTEIGKVTGIELKAEALEIPVVEEEIKTELESGEEKLSYESAIMMLIFGLIILLGFYYYITEIQ